MQQVQEELKDRFTKQMFQLSGVSLIERIL